MGLVVRGKGWFDGLRLKLAIWEAAEVCTLTSGAAGVVPCAPPETRRGLAVEESAVSMGCVCTNRASETGSGTEFEVTVARWPSERGGGMGLGLLTEVETAGLGSSLGAGEGSILDGILVMKYVSISLMRARLCNVRGYSYGWGAW